MAYHIPILWMHQYYISWLAIMIKKVSWSYQSNCIVIVRNLNLKVALYSKYMYVLIPILSSPMIIILTVPQPVRHHHMWSGINNAFSIFIVWLVWTKPCPQIIPQLSPLWQEYHIWVPMTTVCSKNPCRIPMQWDTYTVSEPIDPSHHIRSYILHSIIVRVHHVCGS